MKSVWGLLMLGISALGISTLGISTLAAGGASDLPEGVQHWTAADLKAKSPALQQKAASDANRSASEKLVEYPNDYFLEVYRDKDGVPELHETEADIFIVQSGTATLIVGGTLENAETVSPGEKRKGTIKGGTKVTLNAGDIARIPAKTPHQVLMVKAPFNYLVIKVKGY